MPNIREQAAPSDLGLRPDSRADESLANSGRRIAALYGSAAEATTDTGRRLVNAGMDVATVGYKYMEHQEISKGSAEAATTLSTLDQRWNATVKNADPNDPTVAAKFKEEVVEPTLQKLSEGFNTEGGQKFAESQVEKFRNHFQAKTSADMATLSGIAVRQNITTMTNQLSNMAITDPSSVKASLSMVESSVNAMVDSSPTMDAATAARVKAEVLQSSREAIVKAAALGAINANPEAGLKEFSSEKYSKYIDGATLRQMEAQAKAVTRAERVDENYRRQNQLHAETEASDVREGDYLEKLHSGDPKQMAEVSAKAIATDRTLTRSARERMIGIVERETKPETAAKISNATASDLISRLRAPAGDPRRIDSLDSVYDAYEKGQLSKSDLKFVREEYVNMRTPEGQRLGDDQEEFLKAVKPQIDKSNALLGKTDQSGAEQFYKLKLDLKKKVDEYRKAGKDPRDLMDPSKPESYMGGPAALEPYKKTLQQSLEDTARSLRPGPAIAPPTKVSTPEDAGKLTPGTRYQTPDGKVYVR